MPYLFTSESVSEGHPDKVADQVSDAIIDMFMAVEPSSKVACETFVTTGLVVVGGEINTSVRAKGLIDVQLVARKIINNIGYNKSEYMFDAGSCGILNVLHEQSSDINQGVDRKSKEDQGAGDQGMMFGYATNETDNYMPVALDLAHSILQELSFIRNAGQQMLYLRPDAKSQVTIEYSDDHKPIRVDTIVVSTQHDDFDNEEAMHKRISEDIINIVIPRVKAKLPQRIQTLFGEDIKYHINPTGKFVIGGPHGDTGLTGRKIIVDTYGGKGAHGGGAFSGKDPSKVDRSAAYATRHIAKNFVAAGLADQVLIQVAYAIGVAQPVGLYVNTYGTSKVNMHDGEIAEKLLAIFDMRPYSIETRLKLRNPMYTETAAYGHMGRKNETVKKSFVLPDGTELNKDVELFTWEKLDYVDQLKTAFAK